MPIDPALRRALLDVVAGMPKHWRTTLQLSLEGAVKEAHSGGFDIAKTSVHSWEQRKASPLSENWWDYLFSLGIDWRDILAELHRQFEAAEKAAEPVPGNLDELMSQLIRGRATRDASFRAELEKLIDQVPEGPEKERIVALLVDGEAEKQGAAE